MVSVCSVFFVKQKTAYEMRISDWSSDVCSSDLSRGSLYVTRPTTASYFTTPEELRTGAAALFAAITAGQVQVHINQRFPLEQAVAAHRALETRQTTG